MKTGIQKATQKLGQIILQNSPTILTGLSVAGLFTTVIMAVKATPKALQLIKEEEDYREDACMVSQGVDPDLLTKLDVIHITWQCYIPAMIMGGVTIACIIGANSIHLRRNAALASVYSLTEATLKEYQAKVVETLGEKKAQNIKDEIAKDTIKNHPLNDKEIIITGKGDTLCYDVLSGRYFKNDIENIRKTQNDLNRDLMSEMFISLNEVYYALKLSNTKMGNDVGWNIDDGMIDFNFSSQLTEDGVPCLVVDYSVGPRFDYRNR